MKRTPPLFRFLAVLVAAFALTSAIFADTIRLKDGSLIKGTIVSFADGRFIIVIGEGTRRRELTLDAAEIASIQFEPRVPQNDSAAADRQRPGDAGTILPVSTRPTPKLVVTDNAASAQKRPDTPATKPPVKNDTRPATAESSNGVKPVTLSVKVLADNTSNGWTNSGWIVKKGQRIRITASGSVSLGGGRTTTASGLADVEDDQRLLKGVPTGALLAVIGDDNNDFIYVGADREFTAGRDGALYLGLNEGNLNDNSGSFEAKVEIRPGPEN